MPLLRDDPDLLEGVLLRAASTSGIPAEHVRKDYWLTECLAALHQYATDNDVLVILKGGTSLSKAYRLIRRFSEDADMLVVFGELSESRRDGHLKGLVAAAETRTGLVAENDITQSRVGETRVVTLQYGESSDGALLEPRVKIELHTMGGPFPHSRHQLSPLITEHWTDPDEVFYEDRQSFEMPVLDPCRTLVEKLVLLHEAHTRDGGSNAPRKAATVRHYYDVWCLLGDRPVLEELERHDIAALAHDVFTYSSIAGMKAASRPPGGFAASPAFNSTTRGVEEAYRKVITDYVWPGAAAPSLEECFARVQEFASRL